MVTTSVLARFSLVFLYFTIAYSSRKWYNYIEVEDMRLKMTKTKTNVTYCIIKDYTNLHGKRSTCVYEALGNMEKLNGVIIN